MSTSRSSTSSSRASSRASGGAKSATARPTACILCPENCGLLVEVEGERLTSIRGNPDHPHSKGYLCQKAARLDHYQNHRDRLDTPLKRRRDGSYFAISWDQAIAEIAARLRVLRDTHGGRSLAYYGGGGQGNHLGGVYGSSLRAAMDTPYIYSALAQEKTGDFWVNGELFGRQTCHVAHGVELADFVIFLGTNPWQSHGFPRARKVLEEIQRDPARTMVVIDPRRTETARMADIHLQLRPGTDAFLLTAILAVIVQESREDRGFLAAHTVGHEAVIERLRQAPIRDLAARTGVSVSDIERVARGLADARTATVRADLGIQQTLHSTLNSYLEKLLFLVTGNFGKAGSNNLHTFFIPLAGHSRDPQRESGQQHGPKNGHESDPLLTRVTGMKPIGKLYPPNILPLEVNSDHPGRLRGLIVDSANPVVSAADTAAYREAFERLELSVVIDVALTETAQMADYVLPASSQFEKAEATFFTLGFPDNAFHVRRPLFSPRAGTLPEPEIYRRLCVAMGALPERFPVLERVARAHRRMPRLRLFGLAMQAVFKRRPELLPYAPLIAYQTLGTALPAELRSAAVLWFSAHKYAERHRAAVERAGVRDAGAGLGEALFERIVTAEHGMVLSEHRYEDTWDLVRHEDRRIHLAIPELLDEIAGLKDESAAGGHRADGAGRADRGDGTDGADDRFPMILMAGERRAYNANTIVRDPGWRKTDSDGAVRVHPEDAGRLGVEAGDRVMIESAGGAIDAVVELNDQMLPGVVSMPHGYGLSYPDPSGDRQQSGPYINQLTSSDHCDPMSKTPYHKHVPVRLTRQAAAE